MRRRTLLGPALLLAVAAVSSARPADDPTVYKTRTGSKYHLAKCSSLRQSKIEIKLSEAKKEGLTPCKRCHPPTAN
jgi:competence protein ComEC